MINTVTIYGLLYPNFDEMLQQMSDMYQKNGMYVFKRKKHTSNQYNSYLNANSKNASKLTLTCPAIPTYLLPPDDIINELEKSPKLSLKDGVRLHNWNEALGEFYCEMSQISRNKKGVKSALFRHLEDKNKNKLDNYIYSCYHISINKDDLNETVFTVSHMFDVTQKNANSYGLKSGDYTSTISTYKVVFDAMQSHVRSYYGTRI
jgi:hypothetical protein